MINRKWDALFNEPWFEKSTPRLNWYNIMRLIIAIINQYQGMYFLNVSSMIILNHREDKTMSSNIEIKTVWSQLTQNVRLYGLTGHGIRDSM